MLGKWRLMHNMQKFAVFALALPLCLAMPSAVFADTILTSKDYIDTHTVAVNQGTGENNANVGKTLVVNSSGILELSSVASYYYGESTTAAATAQKEVSIPSITTLQIGQIIAVKPTITSTVKNSTLKLNNFTVYPMKYRNADITTSTDSLVWYANTVSFFVFDGSAWHFIAGGSEQKNNHQTTNNKKHQ